MISDDQYLERLVAGIQSATSENADVRWNETVNGRQFDVVVRFQMGTLRYLVLIEVKNRKRPASASDLEAFVVKAGDQRANKAVFVTAASFQSGAVTVAENHGIDLFTLTFDDEVTIPSAASLLTRRIPEAPADMKPEFSIADPELMACVTDFVITYADGTMGTVPNEPLQMTYYMRRTKVGDGRTLQEIVEAQQDFDLVEGHQIQRRQAFQPATPVTPPDPYFFKDGLATLMAWNIACEMGRRILGNIKIDPNLFAGRVNYTNVLTGEVLKFTFDQLPLGDRDLKPGRYYFIYHPLIYYRCEAVVGDTVHWMVVESFQSGDLMRGRFTQDIAWASSFIPVTDKAIIARLERRFADYAALVERDRLAAKRP